LQATHIAAGVLGQASSSSSDPFLDPGSRSGTSFRLPIFDYGSKRMDENLFKRRTKQLALHIIKAVEDLPKNRTADVMETVDSIRHIDWC
jgi:hypothetical protein